MAPRRASSWSPNVLNTVTWLSVTTGSRSAEGHVLIFVDGGVPEAPAEVRTTGRTVITRADGGRHVHFTRLGAGPETKRFEMTYSREE